MTSTRRAGTAVTLARSSVTDIDRRWQDRSLSPSPHSTPQRHSRFFLRLFLTGVAWCCLVAEPVLGATAVGRLYSDSNCQKETGTIELNLEDYRTSEPRDISSLTSCSPDGAYMVDVRFSKQAEKDSPTPSAPQLWETAYVRRTGVCWHLWDGTSTSFHCPSQLSDIPPMPITPWPPGPDVAIAEYQDCQDDQCSVSCRLRKLTRTRFSTSTTSTSSANRYVYCSSDNSAAVTLEYTSYNPNSLSNFRKAIIQPAGRTLSCRNRRFLSCGILDGADDYTLPPLTYATLNEPKNGSYAYPFLHNYDHAALPPIPNNLDIGVFHFESAETCSAGLTAGSSSVTATGFPVSSSGRTGIVSVELVPNDVCIRRDVDTEKIRNQDPYVQWSMNSQATAATIYEYPYTRAGCVAQLTSSSKSDSPQSTLANFRLCGKDEKSYPPDRSYDNGQFFIAASTSSTSSSGGTVSESDSVSSLVRRLSDMVLAPYRTGGGVGTVPTDSSVIHPGGTTTSSTTAGTSGTSEASNNSGSSDSPPSTIDQSDSESSTTTDQHSSAQHTIMHTDGCIIYRTLLVPIGMGCLLVAMF